MDSNEKRVAWVRRLNSPYINRFLSADTIVPSYANPQSLNRYSYGLNNPSRYTDPSGHYVVEGQGSNKGCHDLGYCSISAEMNIELGEIIQQMTAKS